MKALAKANVELGSAAAALGLAVAIAGILSTAGTVGVRRANVVGFLVSVFLGPLIGVAGAWLDTRRGQTIGVLFLVLAALLSFDGAIATYFAGLPVFVMLVVSLGAAIAR